ncbi:UPF0158 family protein [Paenibacillus chartarius]|uniref:UPF0158 family protein n=1 Tax=Paenibacillus chartarius TaxID=747481 RepID=A0ABV6DHL0_9BACL
MRKTKSSLREKANEFPLPEQDEHFYFIAGYTDCGYPYGITWEEHEAEQKRVSKSTMEVPMKELKLTDQQLKELIETYDIYVEGIDFFLHIDTGEIIPIRTFDSDEEDEELSEMIEEGYNETYFRVPHRESDEGYTDMEDFTTTVSNERLKNKLNDVLLGGRKIFRRYKDTLAADPGELQRYYAFCESRNRERVLEWLEGCGFRVQLQIDEGHDKNK